MDAPPSRAEWAIEGEIRGHSPAEVIAYMDWCDDYAAEQTRVRALPVGAVPAEAARQAPRWLRRWFGR